MQMKCHRILLMNSPPRAERRLILNNNEHHILTHIEFWRYTFFRISLPITFHPIHCLPPTHPPCTPQSCMGKSLGHDKATNSSTPPTNRLTYEKLHSTYAILIRCCHRNVINSTHLKHSAGMIFQCSVEWLVVVRATVLSICHSEEAQYTYRDVRHIPHTHRISHWHSPFSIPDIEPYRMIFDIENLHWITKIPHCYRRRYVHQLSLTFLYLAMECRWRRFFLSSLSPSSILSPSPWSPHSFLLKICFFSFFSS